jgi:hypothetical protein
MGRICPYPCPYDPVTAFAMLKGATFMKGTYANTDHSHHKSPQMREEEIWRRRRTSSS